MILEEEALAIFSFRDCLPFGKMLTPAGGSLGGLCEQLFVEVQAEHPDGGLPQEYLP